MQNATATGTVARNFSPDDRDVRYVSGVMILALIAGFIFVIFGLPRTAVWAGLLWAAAWSAVGWFLGFLFGIPRSLSTDTARTSPHPDPDAAKNASRVAFEKAAAASATAKKARELADAANTRMAEGLQKAIDDEKKARDTAAANPLDQRLQELAQVAKATLSRAQTDSQKAASAAEDAAKLESTRSDELAAAEATMNGRRGSSFVLERNLDGRTAPSTAVNTNLEQISDWLTKIIVGVTLVESKAVISQMARAAELMANSLGGKAYDSFAFAILIYFSVTGLLGSYLLTRLFLQAAFTNAAAGNGART